ncbi:MAG: glycosyltransferase family 39 protein [Phycisphaeraceae bacterium]
MKSRLLVIAFVIAALSPLWFGLGGVPVGARSDGRYAADSRDLSQRDNWLVPHGPQGPHLTKPPLTYWAEAWCIRWFGPTAAAVRVPSAMAGSLVVIGTLLLGWKIAGRRVGLLAAGTLAVMPLHLLVSRLTLTDGLLAAGWFGILAGGYLCVVESNPGRRSKTRSAPAWNFRGWRWPLLLWVSMAVAWMTKGPVAWIPLAGIVLWLIVGRRAREIWKLRPITGLSLSLIPVVTWGVMVLMKVPGAWHVWTGEVGGRLAGGGKHPQGPWYFFAVLLIGMFPATCMLDVPFVNHRWRDAWAKIRRGENVTYWAWAVVGPLIIFSIPSGKLASYITPLCPPLAILTGLMLERWLTGENENPPPPEGYKPPEVKGTMLVVTGLCTIGAIIAAIIVMGKSNGWVPVPFVIVPISCAWLMAIWSRRERRATGLAVVWLAIVFSVLWGEAMASRFVQPWGTPAMLTALEKQTGLSQPMLTSFGHDDNSLSFYTGRFVQRTDSLTDLHQQLSQHGASLVIVAEEADWKKLTDAEPAAANEFVQVMTWRLWPKKANLLLLRPTPTTAVDQ